MKHKYFIFDWVDWVSLFLFCMELVALFATFALVQYSLFFIPFMLFYGYIVIYTLEREMETDRTRLDYHVKLYEILYGK